MNERVLDNLNPFHSKHETIRLTGFATFLSNVGPQEMCYETIALVAL